MVQMAEVWLDLAIAELTNSQCAERRQNAPSSEALQ